MDKYEYVDVWIVVFIGMNLRTPQVGVEVGQMVEKVDGVLHQEDFTLEEVKII